MKLDCEELLKRLRDLLSDDGVLMSTTWVTREWASEHFGSDAEAEFVALLSPANARAILDDIERQGGEPKIYDAATTAWQADKTYFVFIRGRGWTDGKYSTGVVKGWCHKWALDSNLMDAENRGVTHFAEIYAAPSATGQDTVASYQDSGENAGPARSAELRETTRTKAERLQAIVDELNLDTSDPFTRMFAIACSVRDHRDDLECELSQAREQIAEENRIASEWQDECQRLKKYELTSETNERHRKIGEDWERDSSLEKWFPLTAEQLQRSEQQLAACKALLEEAYGYTTSMNTLLPEKIKLTLAKIAAQRKD